MLNATSSSVEALDILIFTCLQSLGILAIVGNVALIAVLLNNKYLNRPSFILMLSLAIADVLHGLVTTCYFYPPIVLKEVHVSELGIRIFNIIDWTAWAITLTHMSAICIDRLVAIGLYGQYNVIVTIPRVRNYTLLCWSLFCTTNITFFLSRVCCLIRPLESQNYYSFGYIEQNFNYYVLTYTPIEIVTISILSISNPITLYQLYKRHKRKLALRTQGTQKTCSESSSSLLQRSQWQRFHSTITAPSRIVASTMLLEMSMKMGSRSIGNDVRELAARKASRQQQRILLQISVVALIFYAYMTVYYVSYYSRFFKSTAAVIFNSFCYSFTHMINPVIYFSLNKELRAQLKKVLSTLWPCCFSSNGDVFQMSQNSKCVNSTRERRVEHTKASSSLSESSPLFSATNYYNTCKNGLQKEEEPSQPAENKSAELQTVPCEQYEDCMSPPDSYQTQKMTRDDRSFFMNQLTKALKYVSSADLAQSQSVHKLGCHAQQITGKFMKMSSTLQHLTTESSEQHSHRKYQSLTSFDAGENEVKETAQKNLQSFSRSSVMSTLINSTGLSDEISLPSSLQVSDNEDDIAFL